MLRRRLALSTVFTDIGVHSGELERLGFAALLDVLICRTATASCSLAPRTYPTSGRGLGLAQAVRFTRAKLFFLPGESPLTMPSRLPCEAVRVAQAAGMACQLAGGCRERRPAACRAAHQGRPADARAGGGEHHAQPLRAAVP